MIIPDKIKVGGHWWTIIQDKNIIGAGICRFDPCEIVLQNHTRCESQVATDLMHELIHVVNHVYNGDRELDEKYVESLAQGLFQVIRDNNIDFCNPQT